MSEGIQAVLEDALCSYKQKVLSHNLAALRIVIEGVAEEPDPEDLSGDETVQLRLKLLRSEYGIWTKDTAPQADAIQDYLSEDLRPSLIETCSLDGVDHGTVDATLSEKWLADLHDRASRVHTGVVPLEAFPDSLTLLPTLVRGVCGPGLPKYRETSQTALLTDLTRLGDYDDDRVTVPLTPAQMNAGEFNALSPAWAAWDIAVGVRIGDGPQAWSGGYVLYCRRAQGDGRNAWQWRFGVKDEAFESELYETLEETLEWYADFNKQSDDDDNIEIIPLEEIM